MRYHDLVLRLGRRSGAVGAIRAQCGTTHGARSAEAWQFDAERAQAAIESGSGVQLGEALPHEVHLQFERCLGATLDSDNQGVRLRLVVEDAGLSTFPWEYLREDSTWLAASVRTPIVRWLDLPEPARPLTVSPPLRMLVVMPDHPDLDAATEKQLLQRALAEVPDDITAHFVEGIVTRERLAAEVARGDWHILHYIGHGAFEGERALLLLNDGAGGLDGVDADWVGALLHNQERLRLVVLNSCRGAVTSATRPLAGMAPRLVQTGVPAVVAMQDEILDEESLHFARAFYGNLLRGPDRGRVDVAVSHARSALLRESADPRAVGIPVLFLRSGDGVLFNVVSGTGRDVPWSSAARDTARVVGEALGRVAESAREAGRTDIAERETHERRRLRRKVRLRDAAIISAVGVACVAMLALSLRAFERLPKQLKPEHYTVWLGDLLRERPLHETIALVTIDTTTIRTSGLGYREPNDFDREWRVGHAEVVDRLAGAGAAVIAFDVTFPASDARYDSAFARAIAAATARGTRVVLAVGLPDPAGGGPAIARALLDAGATWGSACLAVPRESPNVVPLLARTQMPGEQLVPSLSLAAVAAYDRARTFAMDSTLGTVALLDDSGILRQTRVARSSLAVQTGCPIIPPGARVADMILPYSTRDALRARRTPWESVRQGDAAALSGMEGRIVFVGAEVDAEAFDVWRGLDRQQRYGVQLHAGAASALLSGYSDRFMSDTAQSAIILLLALLGAAVAVRPPARPDTRVLLGLLIGAYMAGALALYLMAGLLVNALYHVLALVVSHHIVRRVKRRYFA